MRRTGGPWLRRLLAAALVLLARVAAARDDEPKRPDPQPPVNVFLNAPADLSAVLKALGQPDFVILRGEEYAKLVAGSKPAPGSATAWSSSVQSVAIMGKVEGEIADLSIEFGIVLANEGPAWVPIRLDGQTLTSATEGARALPLRVVEGGGREVEISGRGSHSVKVSLLTPVRVTPERRRIELATPETASTKLSIEVPGRVRDASVGPGEPIAVEAGDDRGSSRLRADLTPRARLLLNWRADEGDSAALPPLLVAQGEIGIDFEPGVMRAQFSSVIRSLRGSAASLELRLDAADELIELELDGQTAAVVREKLKDGTHLSIPLSDPLVPGQERRLMMRTKRDLQSRDATRFTFRGFALRNSKEQSGAIGIAASGNLWVSGVPGRGILRIDPRTGLPRGLSARPDTHMAFRFSEQPFELDLRAEPSPPSVTAESRTTVVLARKSARIETRVDYQTARGKLFELTLALPRGLELESVGPEDVVSTWQTSAPSGGTTSKELRSLRIRLGPKAEAEGKFTLTLVGRQAINTDKSDIAIGLAEPETSGTTGGRIAVLSEPNLTAELSEKAAASASFRAAYSSPPTDWPWPAGRSAPSAPVLWLRYDDHPSELPLHVAVHPRSLSETTRLQIHLGREAAEVRQETDLAVQFGTLDQFDARVPDSIAGSWQVDGPTALQKIELGRLSTGERRVRLKLAAESNHVAKFTFRYRVLLPQGVKVGSPTPCDIPWIRIESATNQGNPPRASIEFEPDLIVSTRGLGWLPSADRVEDLNDEGTLELIATAEAGNGVPSFVGVEVSARSFAPLPRVVATRSTLRSVVGPDGETAVSARYWIETSESAIAMSLPAGAVLQVARVGGEALPAVEQRQGGGFVLRFPDASSPPPILVEIDYTVPREKARSAWSPPVLLDGAIVRQTFWEVSLPWSKAVVGVPQGWTDENEWYWAGYVWKRRPVASPASLMKWVGGPTGSDSLAAEPRGEGHAYLFARNGDVSALPVVIVSRAVLVAACSGSILAIGIVLIVASRPPPRTVAIVLLSLAFFATILLHPSVLILGVQSAAIGVVLTLVLLLMQRSFDRRRPVSSAYPDAAGRGSGTSPASTASHAQSVGSDDSTAIRVRNSASSTMDYTPAATAPDGLAGRLRGSSVHVNRGGRGGPEP